MTKYRVTPKGKANLLRGIVFTQELITLTDGLNQPVIWTPHATYFKKAIPDKEGWAPWAHGITIARAIKLRYVEEVMRVKIIKDKSSYTYADDFDFDTVFHAYIPSYAALDSGDIKIEQADINDAGGEVFVGLQLRGLPFEAGEYEMIEEHDEE